MNTLIALVPAILWGCNPLWAHLFKGKPINQLLGSAYGALIIGGTYLYYQTTSYH